MAHSERSDDRPTTASWKLQDAKARFSELVRRAQDEGPQRVTVRGQDAVVVLSAADMARLLPHATTPVPFLTFMESLNVEGLDLMRDRDTGREPAL